MDTSDPEISFDSDGVCNHCRKFESVTALHWHPDAEGMRVLQQRVERIKHEARNREFDCILGLSGGTDSSFLALKVAELGLRALVVHVDGGWNSEIAVSNIEKVVSHCSFELHTHVMDWDEMRDLQLAYLRAGVSNQDVPQDHAFFANLYHFAVKHGIRTVLSGGNIATEAIFPRAWHGSAMDATNLRAIHGKWGTIPLRHYRTVSFAQVYFWFPFVRRMSVLRPLNYMPYHREAAIAELSRSCGWRSYGRKHGESLFTRFFQNYYLPVKFGYDKRRPHLSSLIVSKQMTRDEAIARLQEPPASADELAMDKEYFCSKLGITLSMLESFMQAPNGHYEEFPNWTARYERMKRAQAVMERFARRRLNAYS